MEFLGVVLASSVIAAIATGLFSMLEKNKEGKLSHIVSERKAWRDDLRVIISNLNEAEFLSTKSDKNGNPIEWNSEERINYIKKNIADLEVRLNTKGVLISSDFSKDREIWNLIDRIYGYSNLESLLKSGNLIKLRRHISLLLKMDWERAKEEVSGEKYKERKIKLLIVDFFQLSFSIFFYYYFEELFLHTNNNNLMTSYIIFILTIIFIIFLVFIITDENSTTNSIIIYSYHISFLIQILAFIHIFKELFNKKTIYDNNYYIFDIIYGENKVMFFVTLLLLSLLFILLTRYLELTYIWLSRTENYDYHILATHINNKTRKFKRKNKNVT